MSCATHNRPVIDCPGRTEKTCTKNARDSASWNLERRPIRGSGYGARGSDEKARKKRDGLVSIFRALLRDSPLSGTRECSLVFGILDAGKRRRVVRPVFSRDVLSVRRVSRQARVRPPTTFMKKATGRMDMRQRWRTPRLFRVERNIPGGKRKRFRIREERKGRKRTRSRSPMSRFVAAAFFRLSDLIN